MAASISARYRWWFRVKYSSRAEISRYRGRFRSFVNPPNRINQGRDTISVKMGSAVNFSYLVVAINFLAESNARHWFLFQLTFHRMYAKFPFHVTDWFRYSKRLPNLTFSVSLIPLKRRRKFTLQVYNYRDYVSQTSIRNIILLLNLIDLPHDLQL